MELTCWWVRRVVRCLAIRGDEHELVAAIDSRTSDEGVTVLADSLVDKLDLHSCSGHS